MAATHGTFVGVSGQDTSPQVEGTRGKNTLDAGTVPYKGATGVAASPGDSANTQLLRTGSLFPNEGRAEAHHHEEDLHKGLVIRSNSIIQDLMLPGDEIWARIAPIVELDPRISVGRIDWVKWKFEPRWPEHAPWETVPPLVTTYSESGSAWLTRQHIGLECELNEASTDQGMIHLRAKLEHVARMIKADERRDIIETLRDTPDMWGRIIEGRGIARPSSIQQVHAAAAERFGIVAKPGHAFWMFDEQVRSKMAMENKYPDVLILGQGASSHLTMVSDGFNYNKLGPRAEKNLQQTISQTTTLAGGDRVILADFRGMIVMEVGPVDLTFMGQPTSNPLARGREVGEYFLMTYSNAMKEACRVSPSIYSVYITDCNYNRGDYSIIYASAALQHCGYFDAERGGGLHPEVQRMCDDINNYKIHGSPGFFSSSRYSCNYGDDFNDPMSLTGPHNPRPEYMGLGNTPSMFTIMDFGIAGVAAPAYPRLRPIQFIGEMHPKYDPESGYFSMLNKTLVAKLTDALGGDEKMSEWRKAISDGLRLVEQLGAMPEEGDEFLRVGQFARAASISTTDAAYPAEDVDRTVTQNGFGWADLPSIIPREAEESSESAEPAQPPVTGQPAGDVEKLWQEYDSLYQQWRALSVEQRAAPAGQDLSVRMDAARKAWGEERDAQFAKQLELFKHTGPPKVPPRPRKTGQEGRSLARLQGVLDRKSAGLDLPYYNALYSGYGLITWPAIETIAEAAQLRETHNRVLPDAVYYTFYEFSEAVKHVAACLEQILGTGNPIFDGARLSPWLRANVAAGISVPEANRRDRICAFAHNVVLPAMNLYGVVVTEEYRGGIGGFPPLLAELLRMMEFYKQIVNVTFAEKEAVIGNLRRFFVEHIARNLQPAISAFADPQGGAENATKALISAMQMIRARMLPYITATRRFEEGETETNKEAAAEFAKLTDAALWQPKQGETIDAPLKLGEWPLDTPDVTLEHMVHALSSAPKNTLQKLSKLPSAFRDGEGNASSLVPVFGTLVGASISQHNLEEASLLELPSAPTSMYFRGGAPSAAFVRAAPAYIGSASLFVRPFASTFGAPRARIAPKRGAAAGAGARKRAAGGYVPPAAAAGGEESGVEFSLYTAGLHGREAVEERIKLYEQQIEALRQRIQSEYDAGTPMSLARSLMLRWDALSEPGADIAAAIVGKTALFVPPNMNVYLAMLKDCIPIPAQFLACRRSERWIADAGLWIDTRTTQAPGELLGGCARMFRGKRSLSWALDGNTMVARAQWAAWYKCVVQDTRNYHVGKDISLRDYLGGGGVGFIDPHHYSLEGIHPDDNARGSGDIIMRAIGPGLHENHIPNPLSVVGYVPDHDAAAVERPSGFERDVALALEYSECQYYAYITGIVEKLIPYTVPPALPDSKTATCMTVPQYFLREGATRNIWLWRGAEKHYNPVTKVHDLVKEPVVGPYVGMNSRGFIDHRLTGSYRAVPDSAEEQKRPAF